MSPTNSALSNIQHIVVLMLENRSFDNVLGWLYASSNAAPFQAVPNGQAFNGVWDFSTGALKPLSNPLVQGSNTSNIPVGQSTVMSDPNPDPGEIFADVYQQMFNAAPPASGPNTTAAPPMSGFVNNYAAVTEHDSSSTNPAIIMNGYTPASLPVLNGLANAYCVCDNWFSSIPSQTFCNRSYVHAGTSSGYVDNTWPTPKIPWVGIFQNTTPTIYNLLESAGLTWRIYYGGPYALCNAFLTQTQLGEYWDPTVPDNPINRFFTMTQFLADAAQSGADGITFLPTYSFIEPNFLDHENYGPENDYHPPYRTNEDGPSNMLQGEALLYQVYQALFKGPNWNSTLLMVLFDEHGGCYDHVPPPGTVPSPDGVVIPTTTPGGSGFNFERLGVRVPAVLISPWIEQGLVCSTEFDHTSVIATAIECLINPATPQTLLNREAAALSVAAALTLSSPRTDTPQITPIPPPAWTPSTTLPLTGFQKDMALAFALKLGKSGPELEAVKQFQTNGELAAYIDAHQAELAGLD